MLSNARQMTTDGPANATFAEALTQHLATIKEHAAFNNVLLRGLVERAYGSEPTPDAKAAPQPVPNGRVAEISTLVSDVLSLLSSQQALLDRLKSFV